VAGSDSEFKQRDELIEFVVTTLLRDNPHLRFIPEREPLYAPRTIVVEGDHPYPRIYDFTLPELTELSPPVMQVGLELVVDARDIAARNPSEYLAAVEARARLARAEIDALKRKGYQGRVRVDDLEGEEINGPWVAIMYEVSAPTDNAIRKVLTDFLK